MTGTHCEVDGDRVKDVKAVHLSQELGELHSSHRVAWEEQSKLIREGGRKKTVKSLECCPVSQLIVR